jgi:hypothetical protein
VTNTADVTNGKPIAVGAQFISGVSAGNTLVAFYDIHGRKAEVLLFCYVPHITRDLSTYLKTVISMCPLSRIHNTSLPIAYLGLIT